MEPITFTLLVGLAIGQFTFLTKYTDFIIEYAKLFRVERLFRSSEYETWKDTNDIEHDYPSFVREYVKKDHPSRFKRWITSLFGCGYCFSTFLSVILCGLSFSWWFPVIAFSTAAVAAFTFALNSFLYKKINE